MNRQHFYFKQKVTDSQMRMIYDHIEAILNKFCYNLWRRNHGITNSPQGGGSLTASGQTLTFGSRYTYAIASGKYIYIGGNISFSLDNTYWPTDITKQRTARLMIYHTYQDHDPVIDGYGNTVYYNKSDSYTISVINSADHDPTLLWNNLPAHPQDGGCSLAAIRLYWSGGIRYISDPSTYHDPDSVTSSHQDRLETLGVQSSYYGANTSIIRAQFKAYGVGDLKKIEASVPATPGGWTYISPTDGWDHGLGATRCGYLFMPDSWYGTTPTLKPYCFDTHLTIHSGDEGTSGGIKIQDNEGKVIVSGKQVNESLVNNGSFFELFCIRLH